MSDWMPDRDQWAPKPEKVEHRDSWWTTAPRGAWKRTYEAQQAEQRRALNPRTDRSSFVPKGEQ